MSGEKRTPLQIAQQDIRVLQRQIASMRTNQQQALRMSKQQNEMEINRLRRIHQEQERLMTERINGMSAEMRRVRQMHQKEMERQAHAFEEAQRQQANQFERSQRALYNQLSKSIEETHQYIESVRRDHAQQIGQLRHDLQSVMARQQNIQEKATTLVNDLAKELEVVSAMPYKKFAAERITEIFSHVKTLRSLPPESQISIAHTAIHDLLLAEEQIEQARGQYEMLHLQVVQSIDALLAEISYNRSNLFFEDAEGNKGELIDIDFWADNQYAELETLLQNIRSNVIDEYSDPDFKQQDLNQTFELVQQLHDKHQQIVKEAIERGNSSAMRASIAEKIAQTLQVSHCYQVVDYGYEQQDPRKSFLVKMRNLNNHSDIVVWIYPESAQKQQLILKTRSDAFISERDLYERAAEINEELRQVGIQIDGAAEEVNPGDEHSLDELYDIAAILQEKGNGVPKSVLKKAGLSFPEQKTKWNFQ